MSRFRSFARLFILACAMTASAQTSESKQQTDWTHHARIAAYSLTHGNPEEIVRQATESHVNGIEVDNDIPGRYESFTDPSEKLEALRKLFSLEE